MMSTRKSCRGVFHTEANTKLRVWRQAGAEPFHFGETQHFQSRFPFWWYLSGPLSAPIRPSACAISLTCQNDCFYTTREDTDCQFPIRLKRRRSLQIEEDVQAGEKKVTRKVQRNEKGQLVNRCVFDRINYEDGHTIGGSLLRTGVPVAVKWFAYLELCTSDKPDLWSGTQAHTATNGDAQNDGTVVQEGSWDWR